MPIRFPRATPVNLTDPSWWQRLFRETLVEPSDGTVTDDSFSARAGNSVIGRPSNSAGAPSDIQLSTGQFLVNRAGLVKGDALLETDIPSTIARDTEVAAAQAAAELTAASALSAHVAAPDPHPGYTTAAELASAISAHEAAANPHPTYLTQAEGDALYHPLAMALAMIYSGTGSPEGVVTAGMGSLYLNLSGGAGTSLYVKESGSGTNTGWVAK